MRSNAATAEAYLKELPADRKEAVGKLRDTILKIYQKGSLRGSVMVCSGILYPMKFIRQVIIAIQSFLYHL